jgi:hypothetical protein
VKSLWWEGKQEKVLPCGPDTPQSRSMTLLSHSEQARNEMFKRSRRREQEQMIFTKSQVLRALQSAVEKGQVDYITSTFISYLLDKGTPLTVEQAKAIGLPVPVLEGQATEQKMIRIEGDDDRS